MGYKIYKMGKKFSNYKNFSFVYKQNDIKIKLSYKFL